PARFSTAKRWHAPCADAPTLLSSSSRQYRCDREQDYLLDARYTFPDDGREPRLSDWGYGVTTCIAAMVNPFWHGDDKGPFIVVASDTLLSFGGYCSMEGMTKNKNFHRDWSAMIAGNDITQSLPVIERASEVLRGRT